MADPRFKRGARPTPRHKILASMPHLITAVPPAQIARVPKQLSMWDNDNDGDCVTAEEAFKCACGALDGAEIFIPDQEVIRWATAHDVLNGADLTQVMDAMKVKGFQVGNQLYNGGNYAGVDYTNKVTLQSAIALGTVKISIDADALPQGAGNQMGWFAKGGGTNRNQDHCVSLSSYGTAGWLYQQLNMATPAGLSASDEGCLLFTWSTQGFVDYSWINNTLGEAWVRTPSIVGIPPLPDPTPPPGPTPGPVQQWLDNLLTMAAKDLPWLAMPIMQLKAWFDAMFKAKPQLSYGKIPAKGIQPVVDGLFAELAQFLPVLLAANPIMLHIALFGLPIVQQAIDAWIVSHGW